MSDRLLGVAVFIVIIGVMWLALGQPMLVCPGDNRDDCLFVVRKLTERNQ